MWFSEKTERPNSTVELGELEPIFFFFTFETTSSSLKEDGRIQCDNVSIASM